MPCVELSLAELLMRARVYTSLCISYTWIELDYSMGTPYSDLLFLDSDYEDPGTRAESGNSSTGQKRRRNSRSSSTTTTSSSSTSRQYNFVQDWNSSSSSSSHTTFSGHKRTCVSVAVQPPASRLHAEVQAFLNLIADPNEYSAYNYSETEEVMEEAQKMPLGRLSKTTIKRVRLVVWLSGRHCS